MTNIIHKVISASSISMCGKTVTTQNKSSKWEDCNCKNCLKYATNWSIKRINKERLNDEKIYN